jgi:multisite-specific tRNA:(cytosine-C5)-methyltransferase
MLKVGGRVVYSTCSLNPIENEAVIAAAIERCGGSSKVDIVESSGMLPGLKRVPGLASWPVMDREGNTFTSWKEYQDRRKEGGATGGKIVESMFPPVDREEGVDLTRCMRVYPHLQDTGGFFITVLEKKSEIKAKQQNVKAGTSTPTTEAQKKQNNGLSSAPAQANGGDSPKRKAAELDEEPATKRQKTSEAVAKDMDETAAESAAEEPAAAPQPDASERAAQPSVQENRPPTKVKKGLHFEEPFKFVDGQAEEIQRVFDFYDISPVFPRDRFMVRNAEGRLAKTIYYTSALARDILVSNDGSGIKFVHCGVKMFVKQDVQREGVCPWRIQTDGLQILESWVGRRIVKIYERETLRKLLIEMFPKVGGDGWKALGEIGEWARDIDMGCCVMRLVPSDNEDGFQ